MQATRRIKLICLALIALKAADARTPARGESSGEYLQKVMFQLQEFNVPSSVKVHDRLNDYKSNEKQGYAVQRINMNARQTVQRYRNHTFPRYNVLPSEKIDLRRVDSESISQYYQPPTVTKVSEPEILGFTRAELAAMYKSALEKGSTMGLSSLANALSTGEAPQVTDTHVEFPVKQPLYQYYFFPLKTFVSELRKDHGYKTIWDDRTHKGKRLKPLEVIQYASENPATASDNKEAAQTTQTQLSSPLFVAVSTFVTMAIVFMMSVLFLPKLPQFDILHSRGIQDDFFYLSNVVTNAIDRYDLLEKFKGRHVDSVR